MSYDDRSDRTNPDASNYPNTGSTAANPRAPQPNQQDPNLQQEPTGAVAADSLAAESLQAGGGFADNDNATAMGVKGASSTLNNTDTSGATELKPTAERDNNDNDDSVKYPEGAGKANFSGTHNLDGYRGGPSADRAAQYDGTRGEYSTGQEPSTGDSADSAGHTSGETYRANAAGAHTTAPTAHGTFQAPGTLKPKGANLTEGGDIPEDNATYVGDVDGGEDNPSRVAEQRMLSKNADTAGAGGERQYQSDGAGAGDSTGQYDVLADEGAGNEDQ